MTRISPALERNLREALSLNSSWLILRSLADEALRSYDIDTGLKLVRAAEFAAVEDLEYQDSVASRGSASQPPA